MYLPATSSNFLAANNVVAANSPVLSNVQAVSNLADQQQLNTISHQLSEVSTQSKFLKFLQKQGMSDAPTKGASKVSPTKKISKTQKTRAKRSTELRAQYKCNSITRQSTNYYTNLQYYDSDDSWHKHYDKQQERSKALFDGWHCCEINYNEISQNITRLEQEIKKMQNATQTQISQIKSKVKKGKVVCDDTHFINSDLAYPTKRYSINGALAKCKTDIGVNQEANYQYGAYCSNFKYPHCAKLLKTVDITTKQECEIVRSYANKVGISEFQSLDCAEDKISFLNEYPPESLLLIGIGFGVIGVFGLAGLCGLGYGVYRCVKLYQRCVAYDLVNQTAAQVDDLQVIDPTVEANNVRVGLKRKKLKRGKINQILEPQPATGFRTEIEPLLNQRSSAQKIFLPNEQDLMHYVRPIVPPKYKYHKYKPDQINLSLHSAHQKRLGRLQDELEQAKIDLRAAKLSYQDLQKEENPALLRSAQLILFEQEQKVAILEQQCADMVRNTAYDGKILELIHKPDDYSVVQLREQSEKQLTKHIQSVREEIIDTVINKKQQGLDEQQIKDTTAASKLQASHLMEADLSLFSIKEELATRVNAEIAKQASAQLSSKLVKLKESDLKATLKAGLTGQLTLEQLTASTLNTFSKIIEQDKKANAKEDAKLLEETKLSNAQKYQIDPALRLAQVQSLLQSYEHAIGQKQEMLRSGSLTMEQQAQLEQEITKLKLQAKDEGAALAIIKQREIKAKQAHEELETVLQKSKLEQSILNNIGNKVATNITQTQSSAMDLGAFSDDMQSLVNQAVKTRQDRVLTRQEKLKKLAQVVEKSTDEAKKQQASELLQKAQELQNEITILQTSASKIKEDSRNVRHRDSVGAEFYNKLTMHTKAKK